MANESADAKAIIDAVVGLHGTSVIQVDRGSHVTTPLLVTPQGMTVQSVKKYVDEYLPAPERRKGVARFVDLASFTAHTKRFADVDSVIFGDPNPERPTLTAVLNYNRAGADGAPRFGDHRAHYGFELTDEWKAWAEADGEDMSQADFAAFVEDRIADLVDPATAQDSAKRFAALFSVAYAGPARVMELSRGLTIHVDSRVGAAVNLATGEGSIAFVEEHKDEAGAPLKVPGAFLITIPVFKNDAAYQVPVRLRYRKDGGRIVWKCDLWRSDLVFADAFKHACDAAAKETGLPVLMGSPEA